MYLEADGVFPGKGDFAGRHKARSFGPGVVDELAAFFLFLGWSVVVLCLSFVWFFEGEPKEDPQIWGPSMWPLVGSELPPNAASSQVLGFEVLQGVDQSGCVLLKTNVRNQGESGPLPPIDLELFEVEGGGVLVWTLVLLKGPGP